MTTTAPPPSTTPDPFDTLLTLEDQFYNQGYAEGTADGELAGRTEGRQLGLERGFQKFVESGRLQGRAIVWGSRLRGQQQVQGEGGEAATRGDDAERNEEESEVMALPPLLPAGKDGDAAASRLAKHISTLYALVETESLSTDNTDEAVDDFDDRLRRAQGRAKVIERMVGEGEPGRQKGGDGHAHDPGSGDGKGEAGLDV